MYVAEYDLWGKSVVTNKDFLLTKTKTMKDATHLKTPWKAIVAYRKSHIITECWAQHRCDNLTELMVGWAMRVHMHVIFK